MNKKIYDYSLKLERILEDNMLAKGTNFQEKLNNIKSNLSSEEYKYILYVISLKNKAVNLDYKVSQTEFQNITKILKYFANKSFQSANTILGSHQLDFEKKLNDFYLKVNEEFNIKDSSDLLYVKDFFANEKIQKEALEQKNIFKTICFAKEQSYQDALNTFKAFTKNNLKAQVFLKSDFYNKTSLLAYFYFFILIKLKEFKAKNTQNELMDLQELCKDFFDQEFIIVNDAKNYNFYLQSNAKFYFLDFVYLLKDVKLDDFFEQIYDFLVQNYKIPKKKTKKKERKQSLQEETFSLKEFFSTEKLSSFVEQKDKFLLPLLILSLAFIFVPKFSFIILILKPIFYTLAIFISLAFAFVLWNDEDEEKEYKFSLINEKYLYDKNLRFILTMIFLFLSLIASCALANLYMLSFILSLAIFGGIYLYNMLISELEFLSNLDEKDTTSKILLFFCLFNALFVILTLILHPIFSFVFKI